MDIRAAWFTAFLLESASLVNIKTVISMSAIWEVGTLTKLIFIKFKPSKEIILFYFIFSPLETDTLS